MKHTTRFINVAVVVCSLSGLAACSSEDAEQALPATINFAPRYNTDTTLKYVHTLKAQDTSTIPNAGNLSTDATVVRTYSLRVLDVNDDGSADIRIALDRFALTIVRNGSEMISFDTDTNTDPSGEVERALQALATISLRATVDSSGNIMRMESVRQTLPQGTQVPVQAGAFYQDDWFRTAITTVWQIEAESQTMAVGDTWDTTLDAAIEATVARTTRSHELVSASEQLALILGSGVADLQFDPSESNDIRSVRIADQALTFSIEWNRSLGALEAYETKQLLQLEIVRAGLTTTTDRRSQTSLRRIDDSPSIDDPSGSI